ncbi:venom carboxylesterase-6-like isoform X2 [Daphnia pulicaria]|uniref:venom carboxylesterase-6-like isoform X2 n=1 Tax=Daphnia pulicaria TaxID=35523 RepID=UPI001EEA0E75|nr:venom carboxylesterase-6-like isoform X2 [Daphnia pulicaria]
MERLLFRVCLILIHCCCCCLMSSLCQAIRQERPIVNLPSLGQLRGFVAVTTTGRKFHAFRGIPYALPPVGELRFRDPIPVKPWTGVLNANQEGSPCVQIDCILFKIMGNEDCLKLNVFTPVVTSTDTASLPVMVWIHGGGFTMGSGNSGGYDGNAGPAPGYILNQDVVLVTLNYRLGAFGFLSTEDTEAPGNYGLLDQSLGLKWVRDNIRYFGGNPDSVTIFGQSAGGASVEFQMLSPHSKGLFHRAIAQSGSTRCPWALQKTVGEYTNSLASNLNCPTSDSRQLLQCLRRRSARQIIMDRKKNVMRFALCVYPVAFGPRVDKERTSPFLPDDPEKLITLGQFNNVPLIAGLTESEGGLFGATLASFPGFNLKAYKRDQIKSIRYTLGMEKRIDGYEIAQKAYHEYFNNTRSWQIAIKYGELTSDFGFFKPIDESVKLWSKHSAHPIYYYRYGYRHKLGYGDLLQLPFKFDFGVVHGDELLLLFTSTGLPLAKHPHDIKVSNMLVDLWTSFATDGVPKSNLVPGNWLPTTEKQTLYLQINAHSPKLVNDSMPFESQLAFWYDLLDS